LRSVTSYKSRTEEVPDEVFTDGGTALEAVGRAPERAGFQSIGRSALQHPWLVGLASLVGMVGGVGAGYVHPPSYTADVHLIVGRTSGLVEDQLPGMALATQQLAADYARLMTTSSVLDQTLQNLHSQALGGSLLATPIPDSSDIDVQATAPSKAAAVRLANAGGAALVTVVIQATNEGPAALKPIISEFQTADQAYEEATVQVNQLQGQLDTLNGDIGDHNPTRVQLAQQDTLKAEIADWQTQADVAKMQADAYQQQYSSAVPPLAAQQEMVQQVGYATDSGSNRTAYIEAGGLGGVVGGLIIGLAAACLIDSRRGRRQASSHAR